MKSETTRQWREKAARLRAAADMIDNPRTRDSLLREADMYERLAEAEERRGQSGSKGS